MPILVSLLIRSVVFVSIWKGLCRIPESNTHMISWMTGLSASRLCPSSYLYYCQSISRKIDNFIATHKVTSPSKVARSKFPAEVTPINCAVFKINRISLKEGGTKRLDEMNRFLSWYLNAAAKGSLVKNVPIVGTRSLSFEWPCVPSFWCSTGRC